jgi:curli biogenesis system outer membrane secretion channel CsgG
MEVEGGDKVHSDNDSEDACNYRFVHKSEWVPKPSKNVTLESFTDNVNSDILRTAKVNTDTFDNFTPVECTALQSIRSNEDMIIKPGDKGSAVVVMDKSAYI